MSDFCFLRRPVEEYWWLLKKFEIRNPSIRNDENFATDGERCGGAALASTLPQCCLPPGIPLRISISGRLMGLVVCCIKVSK